MKNYAQFIKENQSYLTEPYDPEMSIYMDLRPDVERILEGLKRLGKRLGLKVNPIEYSDESIYQVYFIHGEGSKPEDMFIVDLIITNQICVKYLNGKNFLTLRDLEERLIEEFDLSVKENQQYLTEPYDPEFELSFDIRPMLNRITEKMKELGDRLGLKSVIKNHENSNGIFYNNPPDNHYQTLFTVEVLFGVLQVRDETMHKKYNTIEEVEERLKDIYNLKTNENQQYLTEPYDPEMSVSYKFDKKLYLDKIFEGLKLLSKRLKLHISFSEPTSSTYCIEFTNYNFITSEYDRLLQRNSSYKFFIDISSDGIKFSDGWTTKELKTLQDVENKLIEKLNLKTEENQHYLTEPYDPEFETAFKHNGSLYLAKLENHLKILAKKWGINMYMNNATAESRSYRFIGNKKVIKKYSSTESYPEILTSIEIDFDEIRLYVVLEDIKIKIKNMEKLEEYLKQYLKLE